MRAPKLLIAVTAATLVIAACSSSAKTSAPTPTSAPPTTSTSIVPAPAGLPAFYSFSEPIPTQPGAADQVRGRAATPHVDGTVYRVLYVSTTVDNKPTPVTGLVIVPKTTAPASGYPVVTWGHGTNGMADICSPSLDPTNAVPLVNTLLDQGWEVTASDYQGEGTPGLLPYIAGDSAARNTIDIVRAARNLPAAHASDDYVVWGHSEGGQTAMFTLHIGPTYAPELHMKGVVAGAPPSQFNLIYAFLKTSPFRYYLLMAAGGLNAAYGDAAAPLDQVLTPKGMTLVPDLDKGCSDYLSKQLGNVDTASRHQGRPVHDPALEERARGERPAAVHGQEPGTAAHDPGRQRRADPGRVDADPRHSTCAA